MSNRKRQPPKPEYPLPKIPAVFCSQFRFSVNRDFTRLSLGEDDVYHFLALMPTSMVVELHQKLGAVLADVIVKPPEQPEQPGS